MSFRIETRYVADEADYDSAIDCGEDEEAAKALLAEYRHARPGTHVLVDTSVSRDIDEEEE